MSENALIKYPAWPHKSLADCERELCAPGAKFETETVSIDGITTRVWKNVPQTLRALAEVGRQHGEREFMVYDAERVTYAAWYKASATLAHRLRAQGIGKGDRVALSMRNLPEWPVVYFAATSLGAIVVPLNARWTGEELRYALEDSGSCFLVCDGERFDRVQLHLEALKSLKAVTVCRASGSLPEGVFALENWLGPCNEYSLLPELVFPDPELAPDDSATLFYTSGTTGKPKGALGTHRNALTNIFSNQYAEARAQLRRGEAVTDPRQLVTLLVIPMFHVTGCNAALLCSLYAGDTINLMYQWDAEKAFALIEREGVQSTGGVPTIGWQLLEHPKRNEFDLSSIEKVTYGGAPAAPDLAQRLYKDFDALPGTGWGMTETSATVTMFSGEEYLNRLGSCGLPVPVSQLKIMSVDGTTELAPGEVGELWVHGPQVVKGYWNKPEATAETFVDGWVRTGDLASLDEEGFCYIVGRAKEMIIRGGENIYPVEVENALYDHPAITDAAVVGAAHRTLGEEPVAAVHLEPGATVSEDELRQWLKARLASYKVPVRFIFSETILPRNANGKILKNEVKTWFETA